MKKQIVLLFVTFLSFSLYAQTTIPGGDISSGTWTSAGSPYEVTGNITLPSGNTLTIEPGVDVVFQDDYSFTVEGKLQAIGIDIDSIWFYPADTLVSWQGLRFINQNTNGQDSSKLVYCKIRYGNADGSGEDAKGGGIYCNNSSELLINNSELSHNLADIGGGIYCDASSHPLIVETIIKYNQANFGGAIYGDYSNFQLSSSLVRFNQATVNGGGIYCNGGSPVFTSDTISNNQANEGGGMYSNNSNITISSSSIHSNIALTNGGGIFQLSSTCNIFDTDISFNEAQGSGGYQGGGGIYIRYGSLNQTNVSLNSNSTNQAGGGIHCQNAIIIADTVEIINNTAIGTGGGIYSHDHDNINFLNSQFNNNQGIMGGGIYTSQYSESYFENVTFLGNKATDFGGGASFAHSYCNLVNVEFRHDTANIGGGIALYQCYSFQLERVLISDNVASDKGGGVLFRDSPGTSVDFINVTFSKNTAVNDGKAIYTTVSDNLTIKNCIVWDHLSPAISGSGVITATYSDIEGGYAGTGNINQDPLFVDPANGDFHLTWHDPPTSWYLKSPCIDKGDPLSPSDPDGTIADMGPYYYHQTFTSISGNISDTLKCSESPYYVFGDLIIPVGDSLVIEPCVNLVFQGDYRLQVEGQLKAIGSYPDLIWFYPADTAIGWQGIRFLNQNSNGQDSSKLYSCFIRNAKADGPDEDSNGGGVYFNNSSEVEVHSCGIGFNYAEEKGGGIYCDPYSSPAIISSSIEFNDATFGGGIYSDSCDIYLNLVTIGENNAIKGGGIYLNKGTAELIDVSIEYNVANVGGGIYSDSCDLQIYNYDIYFPPDIYSNTAQWGGGGIYIVGGSGNFENTYIRYNNATYHGAGILSDWCDLTLSNLAINQNTCNYIGGGLYCYSTILNLDSCEIKNNISLQGGGIFHSFGEFTISNSEFKYNQSEEAGAIYLQESEGDIYNSLVSENSSASLGGGILSYYSSLNAFDMEISRNVAHQGGGLVIQNSITILKNVIISENEATSGPGGGIFVAGLANSIDIDNVTITNNIASLEGKAIYIPGDTINIKNSIIWNHASPIISGSGNFNATYSNIEGGWSGIGNINQDPLFTNPLNGDYHLSWVNFPINDTLKSPCIDSGDPNSPLDPDSTRADMGAFYYHYDLTPFIPLITSIQDIPNDQGKQVIISWDKSILDDDIYNVITKYSIWRQQNWAKTPWEYIGETPAHFFDEYAYIAPTISDSTAAGVPYYTYLVSAETANPYAFYNSLADSGYSVDNLAPEPPKGFYGYQEDDLIKLFWDQAGEDDFDYFALYKSFDPNNFLSVPYVTLSDTTYDDPDLSNDTLYYKLTAFDYNGNESPFSETIEIITGKNLNLKVFLEGPFFITQMIPFLNLGGYIPLTQPYNQPPWNYTGDEAVGQIPNSDIVDWVLLEFRDATDPASAGGSTVIYKTAAFLKGDGTIVGLDGTNPPKVNLDYVHNLYLVMWHRNHVGVLSALPVVETEGSLVYDFSDSPDKVWGGNKTSKFLNNGIWGLMAADGNADGQIDNKDKNDVWYLQLFLSGYLQGDFDMNTQAGMDDRTLWEENAGKGSFVPE